ncbi:tripartite tricarboxylate transporter TctB family protein [Tamaricihabitans halophyticus]|uniref:Tripartite tricarboxylate transporter TctB family protein n=1 Tax=Tamaricihabitans halophyticus TaxID=1262583 RepID=A0A4R2QKX7_9PSEU|nr:tripartite tricarboxylate transporter TctB family protein [Tamaricihabitans halophyticus]TCP49987.1 tripartite tricarboxylate transporter TctB family protein [Tamaricihabitans halophyticus]
MSAPETRDNKDDDVPVIEVSARYARRQNVVAALVVLLIGGVAAALSARLGVGNLAEPGPGLWPLAVSVVIIAFAAVLLLQSRQQGDEQRFTRESLIVVVAVGSLIGYALLFERIGFEVPTIALLLLWIRGLGRQPWLTSITVSVGSCAVIYVLFISALGVQLPHIVAF